MSFYDLIAEKLKIMKNVFADRSLNYFLSLPVAIFTSINSRDYYNFLFDTCVVGDT